MPASDPQPFYRAARKGWYLQLTRKQQVKLGPDPSPVIGRDGKPVPPEHVRRKYYEVMAAGPEAEPPQPKDITLVVEVMDLFLDWVEKRKSARTYEWYKRHCQTFVKSI